MAVRFKFSKIFQTKITTGFDSGRYSNAIETFLETQWDVDKFFGSTLNFIGGDMDRAVEVEIIQRPGWPNDLEAERLFLFSGMT